MRFFSLYRLHYTTINGALKILLLLTIDAVMIIFLFNLYYSRDNPYYYTYLLKWCCDDKLFINTFMGVYDAVESH